MYMRPPLHLRLRDLPISVSHGFSYRGLCDLYTVESLLRDLPISDHCSIILYPGSFAVAVRALELSCNEGLATIYFRSGHHEKALGYSEKVWGGICVKFATPFLPTASDLESNGRTSTALT